MGGGQVKKLKNFLLTDVKIINKYLLITIILVILSCVGLTSYALFSYEVEQENNIKIVYSDLKGPTCVIDGPDASEIGINSNANYTMNCTDNFGVVDTILTSDNFTVTGNITISNITKEQIDNGYKYIITITSSETSTTGNIKLNSNVIQDINGNYNKESNVSSDINVVTFPSEPTEYILINTYTTSQTWTAPEDGYFQIELFGASGNGGYGDYQDLDTKLYAYGGGGGGGGGCACSRVMLNKGDTIVFSLGSIGVTSTANINSSVESYSSMLVTSANTGSDASHYASSSGSGGTGGIDSGGNYINANGKSGSAGVDRITYMNDTTGTRWSASGTGGAGGTTDYSGGSNTGGAGATGYIWVGHKNGKLTGEGDQGKGTPGSGSAGFIKIYRGNTN